jgi:hypothetical protein
MLIFYTNILLVLEQLFMFDTLQVAPGLIYALLPTLNIDIERSSGPDPKSKIGLTPVTLTDGPD